MLDIQVNRAALTTMKESSVYTLDQDNAAHLMRILRGLYSDQELSVARELICNALDACHSISKKGDTTIVSFGTPDVPCLDVRDFGPGLSIEEANKYLFSFGGSESRFSETAIGNKGLGAKSPFCLSDQFTVISRHAGMKHTWLCFLDVDDCCQHTDPISVPCDEPSGLQTTVPLKSTSAVKESLKGLLQYFPKEERPTLVGLPSNWIPEPTEVYMQGTAKVEAGTEKTKQITWQLVEAPTTLYSAHGTEATLLLGPIAYKIDSTQTESGRLGLLMSHIRIIAPVNLVPLVPSREAIAYTGRSKRVLKELLVSIVAELKDRFGTSAKVAKIIKDMEPLKALRFLSSICDDSYYNAVTHLSNSDHKKLIEDTVLTKTKALTAEGNLLIANVPKQEVYISRCIPPKNRYRYGSSNSYSGYRKVEGLPADSVVWPPDHVCVIESVEGEAYNREEAARKASHLLMPKAGAYNQLIIVLAPGIKIATFEASMGWKPRWATITAEEYEAAEKVPIELYTEPKRSINSSSSSSPGPKVKYNNAGGKLLVFPLPVTLADGWHEDDDSAPTKNFCTARMKDVKAGATIAVQQLRLGCKHLIVGKDPTELILTYQVPGLALLFNGIDATARLMAYKKSEDLNVLKVAFNVQSYSQLLHGLIAKHKVTKQELELARSYYRLLEGKTDDYNTNRHGVHEIGRWLVSKGTDGLKPLPHIEPLITEARRRYPDHPGTVLLNLWDTLTPSRKRLILSAELARIVVEGRADEVAQLQTSTGEILELVLKLVTNSPTACLYAREQLGPAEGGVYPLWNYFLPENYERRRREKEIADMCTLIRRLGVQAVSVVEGKVTIATEGVAT